MEDGYEIRTGQELLGHKNVKTTMTYNDVLNQGQRVCEARCMRSAGRDLVQATVGAKGVVMLRTVIVGRRKEPYSNEPIL